ncbi:MAG TPA: threonine/serine dehydratase [Anaerolineae bacterium]
MARLPMQAILAAHRRLAPFAPRTPLVRSAALSRLTGGEIWLKLECRQPTGSFKVRGALNKIGLLSPESRSRGLVTGSAGNHGLGVAYAAQCWGVADAHIFVPESAPRAKVDKLRLFPVTVHQEGADYEAAHQDAEDFALATGAVYVPAYDDPEVVAGQGTIALEVLAELPAADAILVPVGGGGMIAGIATAAASLAPRCRVIGVQPTASPAALLSLRDGHAYDPYAAAPTIADGLAGGFGAVPFALAADLLDTILLANEASLRRAVFELLDREQLVVEPSGAAAIAPLLDGALDAAGRTVVCILSGANISTALLRAILAERA